MLQRPVPREELKPTLEMIRQNVALQARLIDDLLDVMRIVRGKMPLHWEVTDAHDLVRQAVKIREGDVLAKKLRLDLDLSADSPDSRETGPASLKILIVEDEPATRRLMARLLSGFGRPLDSTQPTRWVPNLR